MLFQILDDKKDCLGIYSEENFYRSPRVDYELLEQHSEGVIAASACLGGVYAGNFWDNCTFDENRKIKCIDEILVTNTSCCEEWDCECRNLLYDCSGKCISKFELSKLEEDICFDGTNTILNLMKDPTRVLEEDADYFVKAIIKFSANALKNTINLNHDLSINTLPSHQ